MPIADEPVPPPAPGVADAGVCLVLRNAVLRHLRGSAEKKARGERRHEILVCVAQARREQDAGFGRRGCTPLLGRVAALNAGGREGLRDPER